MRDTYKRLGIWALVIGFLLLIPLLLTIRDGGIEGVGWNWTLFDFIFMGTLLFGAAMVYEFTVRRMPSLHFKMAAALGVITAVALVWVNGAVGIIGENNPANLMYFGVLVVGAIGALITRLNPGKMAYTLFSMALVQMLIPTIAGLLWPSDFAPIIGKVFGLNGTFALLFVVSGLLFQHANNAATLEKCA